MQNQTQPGTAFRNGGWADCSGDKAREFEMALQIQALLILSNKQWQDRTAT